MRRARIGRLAVLAAGLGGTLVAACSGEPPREAEPPDGERPATEPPQVEPQGSTGSEGYLVGAEDARIHYRVLGSGSDTVVVLHGGPGAGIHSVLPVLEPLAERVTLLFYDQRGGGRSELPADTSLLHARYHVADLEAVRRHFGLERLKLLTHSFGAILAARYAQRHPERVERMVFHGATGPERSEAARLARASPPSPDTALSNRRRRLLSSLLQGTSDDPVETCQDFEALGLRLAEARGEQVTWTGTSCAAPPEAVRYYFRYTAQLAPRTFGDWDFTSGLEDVSAPLLVVHGERDTVGLPANRAWATALPNGRLLVVPGARTPFSDRPEASFRAVAAFMEGEWPPDAASRVLDERAVVFLEASPREPEAIPTVAQSADTGLVARQFGRGPDERGT